MMSIGAEAIGTEQAKMDQFRRYIFDIAAEFIAMPAVNVSSEIDRRLREIGEYWDFGQLFLCRLVDNGKTLVTIHAYNAPGTPPVPGEVKTSAVPWLMDNVIQRGQPRLLSRLLDELPTDAHLDRSVNERMGVKSSLILPFIVGGSVQGGLFLNNVRHYREYSDELIKELQHLGQILAGALERLKAFEHMQYAMRFDRLLSEISAAYINLPANAIHHQIQRDFGRLGLFLNVDRCIFYQAGKQKGTYRIDDRLSWWAEHDTQKVISAQAWIKANPDFIANYQYCFDKWNRGEIVKYSNLLDLPPEADGLRRVHDILDNRSWLSIPVSASGEIVGALVVATTSDTRTWSDDLIPRLRLFGAIFANALKRKEQDESLHKALAEIRQLKRQVEADNVYLRDELTLEHNFEEIIGNSDALKSVLFKVEQVAPTDAGVLIMGETGTGKELIARAIHHASQRRERPLIKVNCASLTPSLIESELFGHEKGAFTGADKRHVGRFELAHGATLFLDEIGELPLELQPKLLRALQEGEFERLGGSRTLKVDVRIIAATNRNLERLVEEGLFRSDLWYRLNTFPIFIPPLRNRLEDIPLLATHFITLYANHIGKPFHKIPRQIFKQLGRYTWPGNVRELGNLLFQAVITSNAGNLKVQLPESPCCENPQKRTFKEMERRFLLQSIEDCGWRIEGNLGAARMLGLKPSTLRHKMKKLHIVRPGT